MLVRVLVNAVLAPTVVVLLMLVHVELHLVKLAVVVSGLLIQLARELKVGKSIAALGHRLLVVVLLLPEAQRLQRQLRVK